MQGQIDGQVVRISWLEPHNGDAEASRTRTWSGYGNSVKFSIFFFYPFINSAGVEPRRPVKVTYDRDRRSVSDRSEESWDSRVKSPRRVASDKKR